MRRAIDLLAAWAAAGLVCLAGCAGLASGDDDAVAIVGATAIHVEREGSDVRAPDTTLVIRAGRIAAIGPSATTPVPRGAWVIDGKGRFVTPGLIDAHVHFFQSGNLYTRPDVVDLNPQVPYAREVARNQARLDATFRVWLASGVTGVVDVGGPLWNFDVRERARTSPAAPRVAVAGPLISLIADPKLDLGDPPIILATSPAQAKALAEAQLARRPDWVKVWFIHGPKDDLAAQTAIVKAAADAAHAAGVPLAVHATELVVAKAALRAGADYLVHSVEDEPVDDEFIELMRANRALYCPTLFVTMGYDLALADLWMPTAAEARLADPQVLAALRGIAAVPAAQLPTWVAKLLQDKTPPTLSPVMAANLRKVAAAGIPIAMGTDAGNIGTVPGPSVFREMALMREAGLAPLAVLRSATLGGAKALRREGELGTLAVGQRADLLVLDGDPLADLANLAAAHRVLKDGVVFEPEALLASVRATSGRP